MKAILTIAMMVDVDRGAGSGPGKGGSSNSPQSRDLGCEDFDCRDSALPV